MIHIITSNHVPVTSIKHYVDNFMIVHHYKRQILLPYSDPKLKHIFQTYIQTEMDYPEDEFEDTAQFEFHIHEMSTMIESIDQIILAIYDQWKKIKDSGSDEDTMIICACVPEWNTSLCSYMNKIMHSKGMDTTCLNWYQALHAPSIESMKNIMTNRLGTKFIYPDEPVSFAYAIDCAMVGMI